MSTEGSVTNWITLLKSQDQDAAERLWERYFTRLVDLARSRLNGAPRRVTDEEDIALSAFATLCRGAGAGQFPKLTDRDDLRHLLVVLTARKAARFKRDEQRQKRGSGRVVCEADLGEMDDEKWQLAEVIGDEPTPELAAQVLEQCDMLLRSLNDERLQFIAVSKLEGMTNAEIAHQLNCAPRTVERKLQLIRALWSSEVSDERGISAS